MTENMKISLYEFYVLMKCLDWTLQYTMPDLTTGVRKEVRQLLLKRMRGETIEVPLGVKKIVDKLTSEGNVDSEGAFTT